MDLAEPSFLDSAAGAPEDACERVSVSTADALPAAYEQGYAGLLPLLEYLDERLAAAVEAADRLFAARAAADLYRGLVISPADVAAALRRTPGAPFPSMAAQSPVLIATTGSLNLRRLVWLRGAYGLTEFDLDLLLIGLAPEIDLRYERLYAYLQDDVTRRRPSVDLALNLLCASAAEKLRQRERFAPDAPLVFHRLIEIDPVPAEPRPPLLARGFRVDEQIVRFILLDDSLDSRIAAICRMADPADGRNDRWLSADLIARIEDIAVGRPGSAIRLYFHGPGDCGQAQAVALLASRLELRVLQADLTRLAGSESRPADETLRSLAREAWLRGALLHVKVPDTLTEPRPNNGLDALWAELEALPIPFVVEGAAAWIAGAGRPQGVSTWQFPTPAAAQRAVCWQQCLGEEASADSAAASRLAERYRLTFAQIQDAAQTAESHRANRADGAVGAPPRAEALTAAAKAQTRHLLAGLATHIEPRSAWADLVLPDDAMTQLQELCNQFIHRETVFERWGFGSKLAYGKGINALFAGPSGTGKTMAAEVIAHALGLDLYRIDLAAVVSKYIGETEKNLERIFTAAERANAILFFDEADALFGKRSEVRDSHDRYANLEISYLLQKMEQFEGIAILATNLRQNLDDAFVRRLAFIVQFPFPDEAARLEIWRRAWPAAVPLASGIDRKSLAQELKLAGGSIKNIALGAAFSAAADGGVIDEAHVAHAVQREYEKSGRGSTVPPRFASAQRSLGLSD